MAEFKSEGVSFTLSDEYTVREQLAYKSRLYTGITREDATNDTYVRLWEGAVPLLKDWQCELIPDPAKLDIDKASNAKIADIIFYVGNVVNNHMYRIGEVDPN